MFDHRGQTLAGAAVTDAIRPGVLRVNDGAWFDPVAAPAGNPLCAHGGIKLPTGDVPTSRLANGNSAHTCRGDVEKFTGELPPVTVFEAPSNA